MASALSEFCGGYPANDEIINARAERIAGNVAFTQKCDDATIAAARADCDDLPRPKKPNRTIERRNAVRFDTTDGEHFWDV
jgi:hypothetical protein